MRFFIAIFIVGLIAASPASACNLKDISFGDKTKHVVDQFDLDVLTIKKKGETAIPERGQKICSELQKDSLVEFIFMDNTLIQLKISNTNVNNNLRQHAKEWFGENDDSKRAQVTDSNSNMALWNKDSEKSVIYSSFLRGRENMEILEITSKNHQSLFNKMFEERDSD